MSWNNGFIHREKVLIKQRHNDIRGLFLLFYVILCEQLRLLISCLLALLTVIEPLMALI